MFSHLSSFSDPSLHLHYFSLFSLFFLFLLFLKASRKRKNMLLSRHLRSTLSSSSSRALFSSNAAATPTARRTRWKGPVFGLATLATGGVVYAQSRKIEEYERRLNEQLAVEEQIPKQDLTVTLIRALPHRAISRAWGSMTFIPLPHFLRPIVYGAWANFFGSDLSEMKAADLKDFPSLGDFFVRELKEGVRPLHPSPLVSPSDGRVLHFGTIEKGMIEQVKGVTYSAQGFLGERVEAKDPNNEIFQIVIYLAPGDYHRFHSAASWDVHSRKHFPGELLSVNPGFVRMTRGLFIFNERVLLKGKWEHGFFSYTAVGATNVGSIKIAFDEDLQTNNPKAKLDGSYIEKVYGSKKVQKGEEVGSFNLGSTIILVFEAPKHFRFDVKPGEKVKVGQSLGTFTKA